MNKLQSVLIVSLLAAVPISCSKQKQMNAPGNLVPLTVDQDPNLPSISVNGVRLHAEAFGSPDSTIIICLHGGPGNDYRNLLRCRDLTNDGFRVVFYDQRGSGLSQRFPRSFYLNAGKTGLNAFNDELLGVINHCKTRSDQKVILLGHSWGGILATSFAGQHPDLVSGLIVGDPGGLTWSELMEYATATRELKLWSESFNDITYQDQFITGRQDEQQVLDYKMGLMAANNEITGEDNTPPAAMWRHGAVLLNAMFEIGKKYQPDFSAGIEKYQVPVLFMYSEHNKAYPDSWADKISSHYNRLKKIKIMGTGHSGMFFDAKAWTEQTLPTIKQYLQTIQ